MASFQIPDPESLLSLSKLITEQVNNYVDMVRHCEKSPEEDLKLSLQQKQEMRDRAEAVANTGGQLQALITDPSHWMAQSAWAYYDSVALCLCIEMKIAEHIEPGEKGATLEDLVKSTGASSGLITARNHFQIPQDPRKAAFCEAFQTDISLYDFYHSVDTKRGERFARAMVGHYDGQLNQPLETIFPFGDLADGSLLVDIGGGTGRQAIRLAALFPQLSCVVQDHSSVVSGAEKEIELSENITNRISWEAHDFCTLQPRKGAAVYLLSHVLMDHTDKKAAQIVQSVVDAMDPASSKLLIHDFMDPPSFGQDRPRIFDMLDLHMIASLSRPSRSEADWDALIARADKRLRRHKTWAAKDGSAVLELRLQAE
ncbi:hypothetical protein CDD83_8098 [Cordyceps sp. RAO-2017]|nr:hypothetical protein CDD83_8098 [Cordyceps sp. RAO-2017]